MPPCTSLWKTCIQEKGHGYPFIKVRDKYQRENEPQPGIEPTTKAKFVVGAKTGFGVDIKVAQKGLM